MSAADHHLRRWVSEGMTGCQFATLIAQQRERIVTTTFAGLAPEVDVTRLFDFGAGAHVPVIAMPVTRRAPYVCIAAWPGEHENPHWTHHDERIVHLLDTELAKLQLTTPKYRSLTTASQDATHELLAELGDDARHYRRAAFRLQRSAREALHGAFAASRS